MDFSFGPEQLRVRNRHLSFCQVWHSGSGYPQTTGMDGRMGQDIARSPLDARVRTTNFCWCVNQSSGNIFINMSDLRSNFVQIGRLSLAEVPIKKEESFHHEKLFGVSDSFLFRAVPGSGRWVGMMGMCMSGPKGGVL
jgi:hypothetical protein